MRQPAGFQAAAGEGGEAVECECDRVTPCPLLMLVDLHGICNDRARKTQGEGSRSEVPGPIIPSGWSVPEEGNKRRPASMEDGNHVRGFPSGQLGAATV